MGRYTLSLLRALPTRAGFAAYSSFRLLVSRTMQVSDELRSALATVPLATTDSLDLQFARHGYAAAARENLPVLDAYTRQFSAPVDFLIPSLFHEGAPVFPSNSHRLLIFYDLIPLLFHRAYLPWHSAEMDDYTARLAQVFRADRICTDSQSAADDLVGFLGIEASRVSNIGGAPFESPVSSDEASHPLPSAPFVLFPSGDDLRKNNELTIQGFERVRASLEPRLQLVVTSSFRPTVQAQLEESGRNILFTGHVSDVQLDSLYAACEAVVFTSAYEGLGLPLLEAVQHGKPVVCSDIPVFREISQTAFYFCDHQSDTSIAHALEKALTRANWNERRAGYRYIRDRFTWTQTADRFLEATILREDEPRGRYHRRGKTIRLAVVGPTPEGYSAIGKFEAEMHPALAARTEVSYFFEQGTDHRVTRPNTLQHVGSSPSSRLGGWSYRQFDAVVYHMGNSTYHMNTARLALHLPGYLILHDTFLQGLFESLIRYEVIDSARLALEERMEKAIALEGGRYLVSLLSRQMGVIVHSRWAESRALTATRGLVPVVRLNLPIAEPPRLLPIHEGPVVVAAAGIIAEVKGVGLMTTLADLIGEECRLEVFGFALGDPEHIAEMLKDRRVHVHHDLSDLEFQQALARADILLNYRLEYRGEASRSVLEAMRLGVAVVVRDIGWYSELPDDVVLKAASPSEALDAVVALAHDERRRRALGLRARSYVSAHHSISDYVDGLLDLLELPPGSLGETARQSLLAVPSRHEALTAIAANLDHLRG